MKLYLVRHGRSVANEKKLVTGTVSDPLSSAGQKQSTGLGNWLEQFNLRSDAFFVSHWRRAQETANLAFSDNRWVVDERLGETDAGDVADWPVENFLSRYPDFYNSESNRYPGGESHIDLYSRVTDWLEDIQDYNYDSVVAVAHSGPISCIFQKILNIDMSLFPAFLPLNASISCMELQKLNNGYKGIIKGFSLSAEENIASLF